MSIRRERNKVGLEEKHLQEDPSLLHWSLILLLGSKVGKALTIKPNGDLDSEQTSGGV